MTKKEKPFTGIHHEVLEAMYLSENLNLSEIRLLLYISRNTHGWNRSRMTKNKSEIADILGLNRRTVYRLFKSLSKRNIIEIHSQGRGKFSEFGINGRVCEWDTDISRSDIMDVPTSDTMNVPTSDTHVSQLATHGITSGDDQGRSDTHDVPTSDTHDVTSQDSECDTAITSDVTKLCPTRSDKAVSHLESVEKSHGPSNDNYLRMGQNPPKEKRNLKKPPIVPQSEKLPVQSSANENKNGGGGGQIKQSAADAVMSRMAVWMGNAYYQGGMPPGSITQSISKLVRDHKGNLKTLVECCRNQLKKARELEERTGEITKSPQTIIDRVDREMKLKARLDVSRQKQPDDFGKVYEYQDPSKSA